MNVLYAHGSGANTSSSLRISPIRTGPVPHTHLMPLPDTQPQAANPKVISPGHTLLVANRGEIAVRILRTARTMNMDGVGPISTISLYTPSDAHALHVSMADIAVPLPLQLPPFDAESNAGQSESATYLNPHALLTLAAQHSATLLHPGYGLLSESAHFAALCRIAGMTFLGPSPEAMRELGGKDAARRVAERVGVQVLEGSGVFRVSGEDAEMEMERAVEEARRVGWPVVVKPVSGGGGRGIVVCNDNEEVQRAVEDSQRTGGGLGDEEEDNDEGFIIERYVERARHVEVQVFGNSAGHVVPLGVRECSVQRRHQKVLEEAPGAFLATHPEVVREICASAIKLCESVNYGSAGTCEFLVDCDTCEVFFLEMNTRIQVEHPVTEHAHPDAPRLDIVRLMIEQGIAEREGRGGLDAAYLDAFALDPTDLSGPDGSMAREMHAIEARVCAENPAAGFVPSAGVLQCVMFGPREEMEGDEAWLRVDTWATPGTAISPHFDSLLAKLIVRAPTRAQAIERMLRALDATQIYGPPTNVQFLRAVVSSEAFRRGEVTTKFLDDFKHNVRSVHVLAPGLSTTVQSLPYRTVGHGIPQSGPFDTLSMRIASLLVNTTDPGSRDEVSTNTACDVLEITLAGPRLLFRAPAVLALTGARALFLVDGEPIPMWARVAVRAGAHMSVGRLESVGENVGCRAYLAVRGGFPEVATYLGSKATSVGIGGYLGRALTVGDELALGACDVQHDELDAGPLVLPASLRPHYPSPQTDSPNATWILRVLPGPHSDAEFLTSRGLHAFFASSWTVQPSSSRSGIRLSRYHTRGSSENPVSKSASALRTEAREPVPPSGPAIQWARTGGGEGGAHPSNVLDCAYARGSVNLNGDTPVILGVEGPDMGGFVCVCVVVTADLWKLGQLRPGCLLRFEPVSADRAVRMMEHTEHVLNSVRKLVRTGSVVAYLEPADLETFDDLQDPRLHVIEENPGNQRPQVVFRQAGDSAVLVEYGSMRLDFGIRARIHAFETEVHKRNIPGITSLAPCIRSIMCYYDPQSVSQSSLLAHLIAAEHALPDSTSDMHFHSRKFEFPIVLDDRWNRDALERYMRSVRGKAVYLPSNVEYLARNNGLGGAEEALRLLVGTSWVVFGVGFYLGCPFLIPADPRRRLVGQKMNPSRTFTPRGAVGIAGLVAAIYPTESPGGYQLFGRTLPAWQTWGRGEDFTPEKPWLLNSFDQITFKPVTEDEYLELEKQFDAGRYKFKVEETVFSMAEYETFVNSVADEEAQFKARQAEGVRRESEREQQLLDEWQIEQDREAEEKIQLSMSDQSAASDTSTGITITAPLAARMWKIRCKLGDVINSAEVVVVVLEAMKTEVSVVAGEEAVGRTVKGFGTATREGTSVRAGDVLVVLE